MTDKMIQRLNFVATDAQGQAIPKPVRDGRIYINIWFQGDARPYQVWIGGGATQSVVASALRGLANIIDTNTLGDPRGPV